MSMKYMGRDLDVDCDHTELDLPSSALEGLKHEDLHFHLHCDFGTVDYNSEEDTFNHFKKKLKPIKLHRGRIIKEKIHDSKLIGQLLQ
jgi:hypothetical protein